ncbi:MAG: CinA family protein [Agathobacter sp.]|nr:CinA family protein [Agathobacter sp.]MBQ6812779.1 CinA family protein [Agathobacter sp.]
MKEHTLLDLLEKYNLKIATAESCTGGLVASVLCDISGISKYFEEGFVTYSENAKMKNLGVLPETIETYGVVSCEVAEEMAIGACKSANANCAVATTGVAGPTGGTEENPVGTVCFACVVKNQVLTERMIFEGTRMEIRMQAAIYALEMLCDYIETCYEED